MWYSPVSQLQPVGVIMTLSMVVAVVAVVPTQATTITMSALSISLSTDRVAVDEPVTVSCHINPDSEEGVLMSRSSMALYCPVAPDGTFCFQNCRPQEWCDSQSGGHCGVIPALAAVSCRSIIQADGEIIYEYTIDRVNRDWLDGSQRGFACQSAAITTEWVRLQQRQQQQTSPRVSSTARTPATTTTTVSVESITMPEREEPVLLFLTPKHSSATTRVASDPSDADAQGDSGLHWFNVLRHLSASTGGLLTTGMIVIICLVAFALSMILNCCCCLQWFFSRQRKSSCNRQKMETMGGGHKNTKTDVSLMQTSCFNEPQTTQNHASWGLHFNGVDSFREGKVTADGALGGSRGPDSDSGLPRTDGTQNLLVFPPGHPGCLNRSGWSSPVTPRFPHHQSHLLRHSIVHPYLLGTRNNHSGETVFTEHPMSEIGMKPYYHCIPVALSTDVSLRPTQNNSIAYGPQMCYFNESSSDKLPTGSEARMSRTFTSPDAGLALFMPIPLTSNPFGVLPHTPPSTSTQRSSMLPQKSDDKIKSKASTHEAILEESALPNASTDLRTAADVRKWLNDAMATTPSKESPRVHRDRVPTKLACSLNTEYDVASDWSEREPMIAMQENAKTADSRSAN